MTFSIGESSVKIPTVTFLLCAHEINGYLDEAIDSCLNQSFQDFEFVIVANGPFAKEVYCYIDSKWNNKPCIRLFITNLSGLQASLNIGLHFARGEFIARMDSDDISVFNRIEQQVLFLKSNPSITILGSYYTLMDVDSSPLLDIKVPLRDSLIRFQLYFFNPICHPSVVFRRGDIIACGGYPHAEHAEDYALWSMLSLNPRIRFANFPSPLLLYRSHPIYQARYSPKAYLSVCITQFRCFLATANPLWLIGFIYGLSKYLFSLWFRRI